MTRRAVLRAVGGASAAAGFAAAVGSGTASASEPGSRRRMLQVSTRDQLLSALRNSSDGDLIWIDSDETIDLTGESEIDVSDVTLASGRGIDGPGAHLKCDGSPESLFVADGTRTRLTGLRIEGPEKRNLDWPGYNSGKIHTGLSATGRTVVVDNCELWGWTRAAVEFGERRELGTEAFVTDCDFHHCQMGGLGYGVLVSGGDANIHRCTFDAHRHAIAGAGGPNCSYTVTRSVHGENTTLHAFDMHGDDDDVAGDRIMVRRNTFFFDDQTAVRVRGVPRSGCWIRQNQFWHRDKPSEPGETYEAYRQTNQGGDEFVEFYPERNNFHEGSRDTGAFPDVLDRFHALHG